MSVCLWLQVKQMNCTALYVDKLHEVLSKTPSVKYLIVRLRFALRLELFFSLGLGYRFRLIADYSLGEH